MNQLLLYNVCLPEYDLGSWKEDDPVAWNQSKIWKAEREVN